MLVKTRKELESQVLEALAAKHPYSVPALIVFEPRRVAASYLEWLRNQTVLLTPGIQDQNKASLTGTDAFLQRIHRHLRKTSLYMKRLNHESTNLHS